MLENVKYDISFIVLHYIDIDVTEKCIESIFKSFDKPIYIVIVDNASPNNSGEVLKKRYGDNKYISVIVNSENLGYAKGNNVGYFWIKNNIETNYVCVINNDIVFSKQNYIDILNKEFEKSSFAVLGPDIVSILSGKHQNPIRKQGFEYDELEEYCDILRTRYSNYLRYYIKQIIKRILKRECESEWEKDDAGEYAINPVLHGSCYFLSKVFLENRNEAFNPETFMFFEEDILHFECMRDGLTMVYSPNLSVQHYEDASTNNAYKSKYIREKWITRETIRSGEVFKRIIRNSKD